MSDDNGWLRAYLDGIRDDIRSIREELRDAAKERVTKAELHSVEAKLGQQIKEVRDEARTEASAINARLDGPGKRAVQAFWNVASRLFAAALITFAALVTARWFEK